ncbi:LysR substrate-binding domain-containing protein [Allosphingosinicella deserti]|uniref:LysR family transcriptional regulator n=1 Tax=Allosphingosinicella deserti TaxID=2116704 RepID=A0A2P7QRM8_9SPHN|nr:LysR substrate-binding domain-containing protein [Sphingomonas deserti]PSJ40626.1 LysR family transcriptional regulator [Sphingomonas deserti]
MRRLPPLSALRAFESAARLGSFKKAATELGVTPTAISHQIRSLEEHSGLRLFERRPRRVVLTEDGAQLLPVLERGFDSFEAIFAQLTGNERRARVSISATTAFTAKWLVPRVAGFQRDHPAIDLQLHASERPLDLAAEGIDLAVRYGDGSFAGLETEAMFDDHFVPVASPDLRITGPESLRTVPLIHFAWARAHPADPIWERWFAAAGIASTPPLSQLRFSDESHAIQAAVAGQGLALLSRHLVREDLIAGRLVQPFGPDMPGRTYHLVRDKRRPPSAAIAAVIEWLRGEAQRSRADFEADAEKARRIPNVGDMAEADWSASRH